MLFCYSTISNIGCRTHSALVGSEISDLIQVDYPRGYASAVEDKARKVEEWRKLTGSLESARSRTVRKAVIPNNMIDRKVFLQ